MLFVLLPVLACYYALDGIRDLESRYVARYYNQYPKLLCSCDTGGSRPVQTEENAGR
jgi:hypothetical protein